MRILMLSQYYWPESFPINAEVARLKAKGNDVTVLTGKPNYPGGKIFDGYRTLGCQREHHDGIEIMRVPLIARGKKSALMLALNYLSFILSAMVFGPLMLRSRQVDVIFVYAPSPVLQCLPALWIGRVKKAPVVIWVQDLWPESISATGYVSNQRILSAVGKLVGYIYRRCTRILVQSPAFIEPVKALCGVPKSIVYVANSGPKDVENKSCSPRAAALEKEMREGFSIAFAGNFGRAQGLDTVIDAIDRLQDLDGLRMYFVGSGREEETLRAKVAQRGIENIHFTGRFELADMPGILTAASGLLVSLKDEPAFMRTIPSKLQYYFAMGRPVIGALNGAGAEVIEDAGAGVTAKADDPEELAVRIRALYDMPDEMRRDMGRAARSYFDAYFAPDKITDAIYAELKQSVADHTKATEIRARE